MYADGDLTAGPAPAELARLALDLIVAEVSPLAASLLVVGGDGTAACRDARSPVLLGDARREVGNWHRRLGARTPLAAARVAGLDRAVVTFADLGESARAFFDDGALLACYRQIGALDDARLLIRDRDRRLVALLAIWRPLQSRPWTGEARRRLESLQPLIEMAWVEPAPPRPVLGLPPEAGLTPRQRDVAELIARGATNADVARALGISRNTVKTHVRDVLRRLGARSRRDLMLALREPAAGR